MKMSWSLFTQAMNNFNLKNTNMKKLLITICIFSISFISALAQEPKVKVKVKAGANPDIYIDGKKYDYAVLELLDQGKIAEMKVYKGQMAIEKYNAPNGAIEITTKNESKDGAISEFKIKDSKGGKVVGDSKDDPWVFVDGKRSSKKQLKKIAPEDIKQVSVLKGKQAMDKYNAPNGVIVIETKPAKKD